MATVTLKNVKKIYPHAEETKKKKSKKGEEQPEKKVNLQVTKEGVVGVISAFKGPSPLENIFYRLWFVYQ